MIEIKKVALDETREMPGLIDMEVKSYHRI